LINFLKENGDVYNLKTGGATKIIENKNIFKILCGYNYAIAIGKKNYQQNFVFSYSNANTKFENFNEFYEFDTDIGDDEIDNIYFLNNLKIISVENSSKNFKDLKILFSN
jgi:hypothetical protein